MRRALLVISLVGFAGPVFQAQACRCSFDCIDGGNDYYSIAFQHAEAIVHARIVEVNANRQARIVIIESFKGTPTMLNAPARGLCTARLKAGDERIYVLGKEGTVDACSTLPVDTKVIDNFRAYSRKPQPNSPVERDARKDGVRR